MRYESRGGIVTRSGGNPSRSIVQRAEALLRSLIGVSQAEVRLRPTGGVERVRVVAGGDLSNGQIVQNIRSALLAAFGVAIQAAQVEFVEGSAREDGSQSQPESASASAKVSAPAWSAASPAGLEALPADAARGVAAANGSRQRAAVGVGNGSGNGGNGKDASFPKSGNGFAARRDQAVKPHSLGRAPRSSSAQQVVAPDQPAPAAGAPDEPVRAAVNIAGRAVSVEAVEVLRQAGRVRCRVVLAAGADRFAAVAESSDAPLVELQLAARVTCDALRAGQLTATHFEGATITHLAGGLHVLVALNGWRNGVAIRRSGSMVIRQSPEQAAVRAVLRALADS